MPKDMRDIIEGGPPEGILSKFNEMFNDKETNTHLLAEQAMQELGWKDTWRLVRVTDSEVNALLQSKRFTHQQLAANLSFMAVPSMLRSDHVVSGI